MRVEVQLHDISEEAGVPKFRPLRDAPRKALT